MKTKKFTILHSNDMHGDFFAETVDGKSQLIGGLSLLSGYLNKVRAEEENVLYLISGDMLQGNVIDTEYKGISTIEVMNYLSPDVVALGNHELDYGLQHLLFLERFANFPIVNANIYIKGHNKRLMRPYLVLKKAGFDILFTGIITEKIMDSLTSDPLIGSFVTLEEASAEVGKICNAYKNDDIDLTILLTHIGFDSDVELAKLLKPEWGVDMIIGGHSHTILEQPAKVNNVLIAQAGVGTNQIGRFDITVDDDTNSIVDWKWQLIQINNDTCSPDHKLEAYIESFKSEVDKKYNVVLTKLTHEHTHPSRTVETDLGNLIADIFKEVSETDLMLVGSGSIRSQNMGPLITLRNVLECFPYNDTLTRFTVTGAQLTKIFAHIMRKENRNDEGECYQVSEGVCAIYSDIADQLISLTFQGNEVDPESLYTVSLQGYHVNNAAEFLGISLDEFRENGKWKVVSTSAREALEEYLKSNQNIGRKITGRLIYKD
jgi:5'-nucleotidase